MASDNKYGVHYFPPTNWTLVDRAGRGEDSSQRQALNELVRRYVPALHSHLVLQKRIPPEKAEDLLQEFLLEKVIEQEIVAQADRVRGRFRNFLLVSLDRFVVSQFRMANAQKRKGSGEIFSIEEVREVAANAAAAAAGTKNWW
jgi:DNA-directed RNA polymerase specialized sigma24 family protein